ncbi:hypothetical protein SE17_26475 [Kouleothrix aurantiaca]|jgi:hypothetical protein|uniref:Uncharacterized protein n=1 Tax=Kouleothrix aurantiaca TaxID=186479 RepID=A0A0P9H923_9CHLR|nr:hypothetical protein SE17_26475 [Kouleothrix aurantiaca]
MSSVLLICVLAVVGFVMLRPAPRTQVIYVPIEVTEARRRLGCMPFILLGLIILFLMGLGLIHF